jgi:Fe-S cluster assembly protein SufD
MTIATDKTNITDYFTSLYTSNQHELKQDSSDLVNQIRTKAFEDFNRLGIPKKKSETYKYTNIEPFLANGYKPLLKPQEIDFDAKDIFRCDIPELDTHVLILANGFYYDHLNQDVDIPGVTFGSFKQMAIEQPEVMKKHYDQYAGEMNDGLVSLNTMLVQDGIFIHFPKNTVLEKPIQIVNLLISNQELMVQHRNLFVFDENTEGKIIICDHTLSPEKYLSNAVTEIYAGDNANIDITRIQNEHNDAAKISSMFFHQEKNSKVECNTVTLHGGLIRNNVYAKLDGEGAENSVNGLFLTDNQQHVDSFTIIEHAVPHCYSNQLFKGVLDDNSTGAFNGKIYVAQDAQKTQAYQRNNNILLTDTAKMHSKPQLEIYADDVKCSHGATMGQLDRDALFYLRTRGINAEEARLLLMYAFAHEIIGNLKTPALRDRIDELVNKRLRGELAGCHNCNMRYVEF